MSNQKILVVGEVVWDLYPDGEKILGGATFNVAYHLEQLGRDVIFLSSVGGGLMGPDAIDKMDRLGVSTEFVQMIEGHYTGTVEVNLDDPNDPVFTICEEAAFDHIMMDSALPPAHAIVYGTLAQRHMNSRCTIDQLCEATQKRFYDVNLRPPHTPLKRVVQSLEYADVVKMNHEELKWICTLIDQNPRALFKLYDLEALVVTMGDCGSWMLDEDAYYSHPGFSIEPVDVVGAGDAFFAAFIRSYLMGEAPAECLKSGNHYGAYIATKRGATPDVRGFDEWKKSSIGESSSTARLIKRESDRGMAAST